MTGVITLGQSQCVATLTIDNRAKANCLTLAMLEQLSDHITTIENDDSIRAVVITGAGDSFFCSGADVREWGAMPPQDMAGKWIRRGNRVFKKLRELDTPVIALLNGHALGGGLELALMADYRLCADTAKIALPELSVGIVPGWLATQQLSRLTSMTVVKDMLMFGQQLSAQQAQDCHIVNDVCTADTAQQKLDDVVGAVLANSAYLSSVAKRLIHGSYGIDVDEILHEFSADMASGSDACTEGKKAFAEKRKPHFRS